ncbi:DUF4232 domain-containing protein [Streptomyces palmae]|uniref:DUF4232 domain-containing protein n=2 Tax=Streptomyces palmae TaxID=1701085 RepID=A0A4Z0GDX3_9ACTN|nr:DUF4232 domain-containing protein [Streptomyces palmae]
MKPNRLAKPTLAGIALLAALTLTACNSDDSTDGAGKGSDSSNSSSAGRSTGGGNGNGGSGSSGGSGTGGSGSSGSGTAGDSDGPKGSVAGTGNNSNGKIDVCRTDELEVNAEDNTIDSEGVVTVSFKNSGGRDCTISGYAGVDLKGADGTTVSVDRGSETPTPTTLADGETAAFNISYPVNTSGGSGWRASKLIVTPPNETKSVTLNWPGGSFPVSDGSGSGTSLTLAPVGKVG